MNSRNAMHGSEPSAQSVLIAIQKARELAQILIQNFEDRIRELLEQGLNQTEVARALSDTIDEKIYRTFQVLRSATSMAIRTILSPDEAKELRLRAWRKALRTNTTPAGRAIGLHVRNLKHGIHGAPLWTPAEEEVLKRHAAQCVWPAESRYAGKVLWNDVVAAMHAEYGFPKRDSNAYKQRYSILMNSAPIPE